MTGIEPLLIAQAAAAAAGSAIEGVNAYQMSKYQAKVLEAQAIEARREAGVEAQVALERGARVMGEGITIAAKGGGINGSAADVLADLGRQAMYEARRAAAGGISEGRALEAEAGARRQQGRIALLTSSLDVASTALTAGMRIGDRRAAARTASRAAGFRELEGLY